jgi:hypothetical protein
VLAELGLEAKPRTPSPLHAQHTMHAPPTTLAWQCGGDGKGKSGAAGEAGMDEGESGPRVGPGRRGH